MEKVITGKELISKNRTETKKEKSFEMTDPYEIKIQEGKECIVFRRENTLQKSIAFNMLTSNSIAGIYPLSYCKVDSYLELAFEMTSDPLVKEIARNGKITAHFLASFYESLFEICQTGKQYFLEDNGYILLPEIMGWNQRKHQVTVCYDFNAEETLQEKLKKLTGFFMEKLNHKEKDAVTLLYDIYDEVCMEHFSFDNIHSLILEYNRQRECVGKKQEEQSKAENEYEADFPKIENSEKISDGVREEYKGETEESICLVRTSEHPYAPEKLVVTSCYLKIGRGNSNQAVLPYSTVSRKHAVCYLDGKQLVVRDLDSLNGTFRNGKKISAEEKTYCKRKDVITFADVKYQISG